MKPGSKCLSVVVGVGVRVLPRLQRSIMEKMRWDNLAVHFNHAMRSVVDQDTEINAGLPDNESNEEL